MMPTPRLLMHAMGVLLSLGVLSLTGGAHAAILYVDKDSGCPGTGATGTPYCTIQNAFNVVNPGDSIRIRDSATPYDGENLLTRGGTVTQQIIIEPDVGHNPIIRYAGNGAQTGTFEIQKVSYITVQNLTFDGAGVHTSAYAVQVHATLALPSNGADMFGIQILNNTFKNWGGSGTNASTALTRGVLSINGGYCNPCPGRPQGTIVRGNTFDSNRQINIFLLHANDTVIEQNTFVNSKCGKDVDNAVNNIGIKNTDHPSLMGGSMRTTIRNNIFRDWTPRAACDVTHVGGAYDTMAAIWCDVGVTDGVVDGNLIYNINQGDTDNSNGESQGVFIEHQCTGWTVKNNMIHHIGNVGLRNRGHDFGTAPGSWIGQPNNYYNNTIYAAGTRGGEFVNGFMTIRNNLFMDSGEVNIQFEYNNPGTHTIDNNIYWDSSGGNKVGKWATGTTQNFTQWKTACGCDANSLNVNPQLVALGTTPNLHIQTTSPAKNAGANLTSAGVTTDFDGTSRPQESIFDMGADEVSAASAPPTITITDPTSSPTHSQGTTPLTTLAGGATDDVGVTSVTWACPTCTPTSGTATCASCGAAATSVSWSVSSIGLATDDNVITVSTTDADTQTGTDVLTVRYIVVVPPSTSNMGLPHGILLVR